MSPLARALLALAAAALLHAACAVVQQCNIVHEGILGNYTIKVLDIHVDQSKSIIDLPKSQCPQIGSRQVGTVVTACDKFGYRPDLEILDQGRRVLVTCTWNDGQTCPEGLDIQVFQGCEGLPHPTEYDDD